MEKEYRKPIVKLLTLWMLDSKLEYRNREIPNHHISNGIWEARGAENKEDGNRIYYMDCIFPTREDLKVGTRIKMDEIMLIEICHEVKIVKQPKYKSILK